MYIAEVLKDNKNALIGEPLPWVDAIFQFSKLTSFDNTSYEWLRKIDVFSLELLPFSDKIE